MARFRIQYVSRTNPSVHAITEVGAEEGGGWRCSVPYLLILMGMGHTFFTVGRNGEQAEVESFVSGGRTYIRTQRDGTTTDNLNSLPEVPYRLQRLG